MLTQISLDGIFLYGLIVPYLVTSSTASSTPSTVSFTPSPTPSTISFTALPALSPSSMAFSVADGLDVPSASADASGVFFGVSVALSVEAAGAGEVVVPFLFPPHPYI